MTLLDGILPSHILPSHKSQQMSIWKKQDCDSERENIKLFKSAIGTAVLSAYMKGGKLHDNWQVCN